MTCQLLTAVAVETGALYNSCKQAFPATKLGRPESELIKAAKISDAHPGTEPHTPLEGPLYSVATQ